MGINPASMGDPSTYVSDLTGLDDDQQQSSPAADDTTGSPSEIANSASPNTNAPENTDDPRADGLTAIENKFSGIVQSLANEFSSLEHTLAGLLQTLFGGSSSPSGSGAPSAGGDGAARRRSGGRAAHTRTNGQTTAVSSASPYTGLIDQAAARHGVDPNLVSAVMRQESNYAPNAVSSAGAMGLMQLMPQTAKDLGVTEPFDPAQNIEAGTAYLSSLIDRYGGRVDLALAAYNAGPGTVDKYGGVPPYPETQAYVQNIMSDYRQMALAST
jgi:hypothetical protein